MIPLKVQNQDRNISARDYAAFGDQLRVTTWFRTLQGEGTRAGQPAVFLRLAGCNYGSKTDHCRFCFTANTVVKTTKGKKKIEDVQVGDVLYAIDEKTKQLTKTTVRKTLQRTVDTESKMLRVSYTVPGDDKIHQVTCTDDHPFHTIKRGFVAAAKLRVGEVLHHMDNRQAVRDRMEAANPMHDLKAAKQARSTWKRRHTNGEYDLSRSDEQRERYAESKRGDKNPMKRHDVRLKNALSHVYLKSSLETLFEETLGGFGFKIKYTGDSKLPIGSDTEGYRFPDFKIKGRRKVIEVYDTSKRYTTNGKLKRRTKANYENPTRDHYAKFGHEVLFLTNKDIPKVGRGNKRTTEHFTKLAAKVQGFINNGAKVVSIERIVRSSEGPRSVVKKAETEVYDVSCYPHHNFFVGQGINVHNCDTSFQFDSANTISVDNLITLLTKLEGYAPTDILVITGGEPTLQTNVLELITKALCHFTAIQVETNGTQPKFFDQAESMALVGDDRLEFIVSPKANERLKKYPHVASEVLWWAHALKFVISADPESAHHTVPEWALRSNHKIVMVSPMTVYKKPYEGEVSSIWDAELVDQEQTAANYRYAAAYALKHNLRLSIQMHTICALA